MDIKAKDITLFPIINLSEFPENANKHTSDQIDKLIELINFYGFRNPLIVDLDKQDDGTHWVIAGNGRFQAVKKDGWQNVPIIFQKFKSYEEKYGFMVSDNAIQSSGWGGGLDLDQINIDISNLGPDFKIEFLGIKNFNLDDPIEKINLDYSEKNKEIDTENFGNDLEHQCPKCGFEFND